MDLERFQEPILVSIQNHLHPFWDPFFKVLTHLGDIQTCIIYWALFTWLFSYRAGCRLILLNQLAQYFGSLWLKALVAVPRPFETFSTILALEPAKGFSFPSGHAINAVMLAGATALFFRKRWVTVLSIVVILLIGFSRVYLGVHYPTDVLGGYLLAGVFLWGVERNRRLETWMGSLSFLWQLGLILSSLLVLYGLVVFFAPEGVPISWFYAFVSLYGGAALGGWCRRFYFPETEVFSTWWKLLQTTAGLATLLAVLYFYPKALWSYWFIGLWITLGIPVLFSKKSVLFNSSRI